LRLQPCRFLDWHRRAERPPRLLWRAAPSCDSASLGWPSALPFHSQPPMFAHIPWSPPTGGTLEQRTRSRRRQFRAQLRGVPGLVSRSGRFGAFRRFVDAPQGPGLCSGSLRANRMILEPSPKWPAQTRNARRAETSLVRKNSTLCGKHHARICVRHQLRGSREGRAEGWVFLPISARRIGAGQRGNTSKLRERTNVAWPFRRKRAESQLAHGPFLNFD